MAQDQQVNAPKLPPILKMDYTKQLASMSFNLVGKMYKRGQFEVEIVDSQAQGQQMINLYFVRSGVRNLLHSCGDPSTLEYCWCSLEEFGMMLQS